MDAPKTSRRNHQTVRQWRPTRSGRPNLDLGLSCSFISSDDPVAAPSEVANGDCSNKSAIQDLYGHGTHVASIIGAPVNGIGIAGVRSADLAAARALRSHERLACI